MVCSSEKHALQWNGEFGELFLHIVRISMRRFRTSAMHICVGCVIFLLALHNNEGYMNVESRTGNSFSIKRELAQLPEADAEYLRTRLCELETMARNVTSYSIRDDSRLAFRFVRGEVRNMSAYDVVHEMACMQFLCEKTAYQSVLPQYLRSLASHVRNEFQLPWQDTWRIVSELGPELLKSDILEQSALVFPDFIPSDESTS